MRTNDLAKLCGEHMAGHPIAAEMTFAGDHLVLGAGTRLAKLGAPLDESRLAALLTSAYGGPIEASRLTHVRRAVETWREGNRPLALTHLALSRLAKLSDPIEAARRLLLADALMSTGVSPAAVTAALTLKTANEASPAAKYSPDQPRVPAGNTGGGQWTNGGSSEAVTGGNPGGFTTTEGPASQDTQRIVYPDGWQACHEKCLAETESVWPPSNRPAIYRRCVRECLGPAGEDY